MRSAQPPGRECDQAMAPVMKVATPSCHRMLSTEQSMIHKRSADEFCSLVSQGAGEETPSLLSVWPPLKRAGVKTTSSFNSFAAMLWRKGRSRRFARAALIAIQVATLTLVGHP